MTKLRVECPPVGIPATTTVGAPRTARAPGV